MQKKFKKILVEEHPENIGNKKSYVENNNSQNNIIKYRPTHFL